MMNRRTVLALPAALYLSGCMRGLGDQTVKFADDPVFAGIEKRIGGRVGAMLMAHDGQVIASHRAAEKFAMCSTFKAPLAAALFMAHDRGELDQFTPVTVTENDLVPYAPFVKRVIRENRMTSLYELANKTVDYSDNAAANIILRALGGPGELTRFFAKHGGQDTRLDRFEPEMNENAVGDPRDTTTPYSMANLMRHILIKKSAGPKNAAILTEWLVKSATGKARIEAGIPDDWNMGDKTGTAPPSAPAYNDVAILMPPQLPPFMLAVFLDRPDTNDENADAAIADIARHAAEIILATDPQV